MPEAPTSAGEVRKIVTVVFCDVTGSTALGERLDPEALRRVMTRYFAAMTEAIERHGGTVEKFIGDAVMAVFGIPATHEDDAVRAVRAAADMREALRLLNKELERDHGATLTCRIGVNTGEVVAGDATTRQALVTGDAVNVAARLEQSAPPGEILIAETTLRLVRDAVVTEGTEPLELKGKSEPVSAHRLIEVHAGAAGVARRLDSPLVGRERQLAQLLQAFEDATADNVCHLFTVLGPPGVGKSRLVQEALEGMHGATIVQGRCLSYGEGITYWPLVEIVRDAVGPDVAGDLAAQIATLIPDDPSAGDVAARIAQLTGGATDLALPAEEVGWAVRRFIEGMAKARPLVIVLDDLHWAEPSLLDLIDQVTDWSRDAPILVVCMARPELLDLRADWGGGKLHATTTALEPLSVEETGRLVGNLLGDDGLDPSARTRIVTASEGNPLFVEETIAMLVDDGLLHHQGDRWITSGDLGDVAVPPTIQALLAARLDRLDEGERAVLGRAAVVGQVFYLGALGELSPDEERAQIASRVQQLVRRDLVRTDRSDLPGQDAFRFHHGLLRDAAYQMLPKETRADLHERFATWLEQHEEMTDADEFVGYHLERAHAYRIELGPEDDRSRALAEQAATRLSAAASRAFDRGDTAAAESLARRAAALRAEDDPRRAWDLIALGWTFTSADRADEADGAFEEALRIARTVGDERSEAHASLGGAMSRGLIDPEGASDVIALLVERLLPRFEDWGDERGLGIAYLARSQIHWNRCEFALGRRDSALAVPHARAAGDGTFERVAVVTQAFAGLLGPASVDQSLADIDELEAMPIRSIRGLAISLRAAVEALKGHFDDARRLRDEAIEALREVFGQVPAGGFEASWRLETLAGDAEAAEMWGRKGYELLGSYGDVAHGTTAAVNTGISCYDLERFDEAWRLAEECREKSASDDAINQFLWRSLEAKLHAREGRFDEAEALLREANEIGGRTDEFMGRSIVAFDEAEVAVMAGRTEDARTALRRALEMAERKGATANVDKARRRLGELDAD